MNSFAYMHAGRVINEDRELGGYTIPKETSVHYVQRAVNMKEEYVPKPQEFIPERHEKKSPLEPCNNYVSTPFGVGARKCPGSRIATTELHFAIINMVRHFKLSHENPEQFPPTSFDQVLNYIDFDKNPLYFTPREHCVEYVKSHARKN